MKLSPTRSTTSQDDIKKGGAKPHGKPYKPNQRSKPNQGKNGKKDNNKISGESKECAYLSPCLNDVNRIDEQVASALSKSGDTSSSLSSTSKLLGERIEAIEKVHSWYTNLIQAVDVNIINRLLSDGHRVRCVPSELTRMVSDARNVIEEIRLRRIPELITRSEQYNDILQRIHSLSTKSDSPFSEKNGGVSFPKDVQDAVLSEKLAEGNLLYRGISLSRLLEDADKLVRQNARADAASSSSSSSSSESELGDLADSDPLGDIIGVYYDHSSADRFFMEYVLVGDQGSTTVIGFSLNKGLPTDMKYEPNLNTDNVKILLTSSIQMGGATKKGKGKGKGRVSGKGKTSPLRRRT